MRICGLKLSHDSAIAVLEDGKLLVSVELEKIANNRRFAILRDLTEIEGLLDSEGFSVASMDSFVVDGWVGAERGTLPTRLHHQRFQLPVARYEERGPNDSVLSPDKFNSLPLGNHEVPYLSYPHVAGHIAGAYCTSPFARRKQSALVLVWDGGMWPRLYYVDMPGSAVHNLGPLFYLSGNLYSIFGQHFRPFQVNENVLKDELSVAGKVMAYAALGEERADIQALLRDHYRRSLSRAMDTSLARDFAYDFAWEFAAVASTKYRHRDLLASFHAFLQELLLGGLQRRVEELGLAPVSLCFSGGCALNVRWNSALRNASFVDEMWICPFPNDSGSAIGAGCCEMLRNGAEWSLDWDVYSGPRILQPQIRPGWRGQFCPPEQLGKLLHSSEAPVAILHGRAELGPRALGNRSILASPLAASTMSVINELKMREWFRPVAPVCMEDRAAEIFDPGCCDPFMLFTHRVRPAWVKRIPAVCHIDGTARLQTVNSGDNPVLYSVLRSFEQYSGVPVLCNTSANARGCGFFPDVGSAMDWGGLDYIWSEDYLYTRTDVE